MNLLEAIQGAGENWFRPVAWSKYGSALFIGKRGFLVKSFWHGGESELFTVAAHDLTGEWEIVTPEQVLSERKL